MTFQTEKVSDFLTIFEIVKTRIRAMPGCHYLELLRDIDQPNVFMTYSYWDDEAALNQYRNAVLFKETWAKTKVLFAEKPMAYSVESLEKIA